MLHAVSKAAVSGFCGLFQAFSNSVIEPAVVAAANSGILDATKLQRRAAVGAVECQ
jgi:hypothetical protein